MEIYQEDIVLVVDLILDEEFEYLATYIKYFDDNTLGFVVKNNENKITSILICDFDDTEKKFYLSLLETKIEYQRRGYGKMLTIFALQYVPNGYIVETEVEHVGSLYIMKSITASDNFKKLSWNIENHISKEII